jgi:hypothetical protein
MQFIPTQYNGHTFRSLMEARWAVFFDYFGFRWDYEPHGFQQGEEKYLPDFYMPEFDVYVEVKYKDDPQAIALSKKFVISHNIDIIICSGNPHIRPLLLFAGSDKRFHLGMDSKILWFYKKGEGLAYGAQDNSPRPEYREAVNKAINARFGVMEIINMLGKARRQEASNLMAELKCLQDKHGISQNDLDKLVSDIYKFNTSTCLRAFHDAYQSKIDGLSFQQEELTDNFNFNKGL